MTTHTGEEPQLTRRERQRQATYDEIVEVSRDLMRRHEDLSLRAIAKQMGMTPPALYRYVDSYQDLVLLVAQAILSDVISELESARTRHPDEDPAAQIIASAVAFRRWARGHRDEFALLFANTATAEGAQDEPAPTVTTFDAFFADMFLAVWRGYGFALPGDEDLDPRVLAAIDIGEKRDALPCMFPGEPAGLSWMFARAWVRLYGTVTLEVFGGSMDPEVIDSGALFRATLDDIAADLNFGDDWPRLRQLMIEEMRHG